GTTLIGRDLVSSRPIRLPRLLLDFVLMSCEARGIYTPPVVAEKTLGRSQGFSFATEAKTPPYKWWNWHDNYDAEASPDPKWVEVSDTGEAAFRKRDAEAKA